MESRLEVKQEGTRDLYVKHDLKFSRIKTERASNVGEYCAKFKF